MSDIGLSSRLLMPVVEPTTVVSLPRSRPRFSLPRLSLTIAERRVVLAVVDLFVLNVALLLTMMVRGNPGFSWEVFVQAPHYFALLVAVWVVWAAFFDCYDVPRTADASQSAWSAAGAALFAALSYLIIPFYTPYLLSSRLSSLLFVGLAVVGVPCWRVIYAVIFSQPTFQQRLLVVGAGQSGSEIAQVLASTPQRGNPYAGSGYRLVGFVDDDPAKVGSPVLGNRHDLLRLVQEKKIDLLVVAISHPAQIHPELFQVLLDCRERGVAIEQMTSLYERLTGKVLVEHAGRDLSVVMPAPDSPTRHIFFALKRLMDLVAGVCGLVALVLIAPWIALANAIFCPGPLFYRQKRVGKGGKVFVAYKFRSMIPFAEKNGAVWAGENDDRITPVGRILRKTRLDELPQFLNVLKGEMSLIGPRPERPEFVAMLSRQVPFYQARHAVRPGITGWAQVRYRYGSSVEDALVKLQYDLYYIKRQSLYLELSILAKTVAVMLKLEGR